MNATNRVTEPGRVVAVEDHGLWIETDRKSTCSSCSAQKACGHGLMNKASFGTSHRILIPLEAIADWESSNFAPGDEVELTIPETLLVTSALIVYLLPLIVMLIGALLGSMLALGDVPAVMGAVIGFALGMFLVKIHAVKNCKNKEFRSLVRPITSRHNHSAQEISPNIAGAL